MSWLFGKKKHTEEQQVLERLRAESLRRLAILKETCEHVDKSGVGPVSSSVPSDAPIQGGLDWSPSSLRHVAVSQKPTTHRTAPLPSVSESPPSSGPASPAAAARNEEYEELQRHILDKKIAIESIQFAIIEEELADLYRANPRRRRRRRRRVSSTDSKVNERIHTNPGVKELSSAVSQLEAKILRLQSESELVELPQLPHESDLIGKPPEWTELLREHVLHSVNTPAQANYVELLLADNKSREARAVARMINSFYPKEGEEKESGGGDGEEGEDEPDVVSFLIDLRTHIQQNHAECTMDEEEIDITLEAIIFPKIYSRLFQLVERPEEDALLHKKCELFSQATQNQFFIKPDYQSGDLVPYAVAIAKLQSIYFAQTPLKKLYTILSAAEALYQHVESIAPGAVLGGDDFIDIWIFVTVKANVHKLASTVEFIKEYANTDYMKTELGYYLTALELACTFVHSLDSKRLARKRFAIDTFFVVAERERYKKLCATHHYVKDVFENVQLKGYQLVVLPDWMLDPQRWQCVFLVKTGSLDDVAVVSVYTTNEHINEAQRLFLNKMVLEPDQEGLSVQQTVRGNVVMADVDALEAAGVRVERVQGGDFEAVREEMMTRVQMERLGCVGDNAEDDFRHSYGADAGQPLGVCIAEVVQCAKSQMQLLGFFPIIAAVDGPYNSVMSACVKAFQMAYNATEEETGDEASGVLSPQWMQRMRLQLTSLVAHCCALGFAMPPMDVTNTTPMIDAVRVVQEYFKLSTDGVLGPATRAALQRAKPEWEEERVREWLQHRAKAAQAVSAQFESLCVGE